MPPKKSPKKSPLKNRSAPNGEEQYCQKCHTWKPKYPDFKAARGTSTVATCQACRDLMAAHEKHRRRSTRSTLADTTNNLDNSEGELPRTGNKRGTDYAQNTPLRKTSATTFNPYARPGHSQDTAIKIAAKREIGAIQRRHRFIDRAGGEHSPTPPFADVVRRQASSGPPSPITPSPFFHCTACTFPRPKEVQSPAQGVCIYCQHPSQATVGMELMWCRAGDHEASRFQFTRSGNGIESKVSCNACYYRPPTVEDDLDDDYEQTYRSRASSVSSYRRGRTDSPSSDFFRFNMEPSPSPIPSRLHSPAPQGNRSYDTSDPPIDYDRAKNDPNAPALSEQDWKYVQDFHNRLEKEVREECSRCKEVWFNIKVVNGVCQRCQSSRDRNKKDDEPFLMSAGNDMDPGDAAQLPELSQVEEMLIARVHCFVEVHQVRGAQYKYTGHVVNFLRDVGKVYNKLPLLPKDLEIVLLKPANTSSNAGLDRQFKKDYKVRRAAVQQWLDFLKQNHPGYADLEIDQQVLSQLPENGHVSDQITTMEIDAIDALAEVDIAGLDEEEPVVAALPNALPVHTELEQLQQAVSPHLTQPAFRSTPLSEFNKSQALLSLAFPTLFPRGEAEYTTSRVRHVSYSAYIEHLIKYKDGRFARHPRFRYVVFNTMMRSQVSRRSTYFVNKMHGDEDNLDIEAIKAAFINPNDPEAERLLNSIVRYSASLRGTRPFWLGKRRNLETYVYCIRSPDMFLTFSAADYHWESLHRAYGEPHYQRWFNGTPAERMRITRECLRDNPHIAAYHFYRRFKAVMECIIIPKFGVTDWWNRYEFQSRGSSHNHGFIWLAQAPELNVSQETSRAEFAAFWNRHITAILPLALDRNLQDRTPMSLPPEDQKNTLHQLDALANSLQRHTCTDSYCLRVKKGAPADSEKFCRFNAPWELREEPVVDKSRNPRHWMFQPTRNDAGINAYSPLITMAWMANTDTTPCTGSKAVLNYIAKYCSKEETKSTSFKDLVTGLLPHLNSERPLLSLVSKTMNKLIGERDWSSQEVFQILLNIPLQEGSREVVSLDCRPNQASQAVQFEDGEMSVAGVSKLQKYCSRPEYLDELSFFEFLTRYNFKSFVPRPKAKPRIINYFPRYTMGKDAENFARVKVMLHHPFRRLEDLLQYNQTEHANWKSALQICQHSHTHEKHPLFEVDGFGDTPDVELEEEEFEIYEDRAENELFWAELAAQRPGRDDAAQFEDPNSLGSRNLDREFDWSVYLNRHPELPPDWLKIMKEQHPKSLAVEHASQSVEDILSVEQAQVYKLTMQQEAQRALHRANPDSPPPPQLLLQVDGKAGTGKSFTIHFVSSQLQERFPPNPVQRAAPTGVASHGISGRTIHSLLRLPITAAQFQPLLPPALASLQATFRHTTTLIIDEKSMLSLQTLAWINLRLRQIFPHSDQPFGGIDIQLWGDYFQLPPVLQRALYDNTAGLKTEYEILGQTLIKLFDKTIELKIIMRQQGEDLEQQQFRHALEGLRNNNVTQAHWKLLTKRVQAQLPHAEVLTFEHALRIYGKKKDVNQYNHCKMRDLKQPVKQIKALHTGSGAELASWEQGGNLHKTLPLCIGARVMLTENSWTERGLVNGALGTIRDLHWNDGDDIDKQIPTVLIQFDKYDGPVLGDDNTPLIPITASKREYNLAGTVCTRTQLPLTIAWAITIHKAQGITAEKVVTNIAEKDHVVGLTYVAVSRVKELKGLMFEEPFDYSRFQGKESRTETMRLADYARRLPQHVPIDFPPL